MLLSELQRTGIIPEMGNDFELRSLFANAIIILPKWDTVKFVIDARNLI